MGGNRPKVKKGINGVIRGGYGNNNSFRFVT